MRQQIAQLPIYPEQRLCKKPTTEAVLRLFSLAQRHTLLKDGVPIKSFDPELSDLPLQVLALLGISAAQFRKK